MQKWSIRVRCVGSASAPPLALRLLENATSSVGLRGRRWAGKGHFTGSRPDRPSRLGVSEQPFLRGLIPSGAGAPAPPFGRATPTRLSTVEGNRFNSSENAVADAVTDSECRYSMRETPRWRSRHWLLGSSSQCSGQVLPKRTFRSSATALSTIPPPTSRGQRTSGSMKSILRTTTDCIRSSGQLLPTQMERHIRSRTQTFTKPSREQGFVSVVRGGVPRHGRNHSHSRSSRTGDYRQRAN